MEGWGWIIAGGAAATGAVTMFWGYIRNIWSQIISYVIVTCENKGLVEEAISSYLWNHFKSSAYGTKTFMGFLMFVRPTSRVQAVGMEIVGRTPKLFWDGWKPIWATRREIYGKNQIALSNCDCRGGTGLTFIRGTFNYDKLVCAALTAYNQTRSSQCGTRYAIRHIFGTDNKPQRIISSEGILQTGQSNNAITPTEVIQHRILQWKLSQLGSNKINHGDAVGQLALDSESKKLINDIEIWKNNENWYKERKIPWKVGLLLYGPPGSGKTSIIRAVSEDFDLPIYTFHLSTLYDDELQSEWQKMQTQIPCVALIEDVDTIFHGRENIAGGHLTFDCLLNCLDGVERTDGILLAVTTNCLEHLDPALGVPDKNNNSTRPGRLDKLIKMGPLDKDGRMRLCRKILADSPNLWEEVVSAGDGELGAQFQNRCIQMALSQMEKK
jgi:hypothetical protein